MHHNYPGLRNEAIQVFLTCLPDDFPLDIALLGSKHKRRVTFSFSLEVLLFFFWKMNDKSLKP